MNKWLKWPVLDICLGDVCVLDAHVRDLVSKMFVFAMPYVLVPVVLQWIYNFDQGLIDFKRWFIYFNQ